MGKMLTLASTVACAAALLHAMATVSAQAADKTTTDRVCNESPSIRHRPLGKELKISGLAWMDAYYMAANHKDDYEGKNGFLLRKMKLAFDTRFSERLDGRIRFDMTGADFNDPSRDISARIDRAYLCTHCTLGRLYLGMSTSPTFWPVEHQWGYRCPERSPLDMQKWGTAMDTGIALKSVHGRWGCHAMVADGEGLKSENESGKKAMLLVWYGSPRSRWFAAAYGDYDENPLPSRDVSVCYCFAGYRGRKGRIGILAAHRELYGVSDDQDMVCVLGATAAGSNRELVFRVDHLFDPAVKGEKIPFTPFSPRGKPTLILLGVGLDFPDKIKVIPSIEYVHYSDTGGSDVDDDAYLRVTLAWGF